MLKYFITFLSFATFTAPFVTHVDYAEQFLYDKKTSFPALVNLEIEYELLIIVTNNFSNDAVRLNCTKLKRLDPNETFVPLFLIRINKAYSHRTNKPFYCN